MTISLISLLVRQTKDQILDAALAVARGVGLPVSSWQAGDPTRTLLSYEAEFLATLEGNVVGYIASGFLDYASGVWLKILAQQVYGVEVPPATYATTDVELTNSGDEVFILDPGDVIVKSSLSGKTYRSTTGGTLGAGGTLTLTFEAEEGGSGSSAGAGEIDELVTGMTDVTVTNPIAAVGIDEQSEATTRQQCRDKLDSLSPNGPKGAYSYVARNRDLTGTSNITRVRVYSDSDTGDVTVYLAGPSGAVSNPDRALVEAAILKWATPLCITPEVLSASNVSVGVTYQIWLYASANRTSLQVQADVLDALQAMFAARPIGGDIISPAASGSLYKSLIESTIRGVYPEAFRVSVSSPAGDTALTNGQVAVLGIVTPTVTIEVDP